MRKSLSPWYAVELDEGTAPWAYDKDGQPFRVIAPLAVVTVIRGEDDQRILIDIQCLQSNTYRQ